MSSVPVLISTKDEEIVIDIPQNQINVSGSDARRIADALHDAADILDAQGRQPSDEVTAHQEQEDEAIPESDEDQHDTRPVSAPSPLQVAKQTIHPAETVTPPQFVSRSGGVRFSSKVRDFLEDSSIDESEITEVINNPDEEWEGINPGAITRPTVAVRYDAPHGAIFYLNEDGSCYVISVQPRYKLEEQRRELRGGQRRISGGPKIAAIDSLQVLVSKAKAVGLEFEQGKNHGKIFDPKRPELGHYTVAITPSDFRAYTNAASDIRKMFDVDL